MAQTTPPRPPRRTAPKDTPSGTGTPGTSDTPPRRSAPGPGSSGQGAGASTRRQTPSSRKLQQSLEELFTAPALIYAATGDQWAAEFVKDRGPVLAEAWANLAQESPAVKRVLERITQGTAWGGVIAATGMTVIPLVAHHGLLPPQIAAFIPHGNGPANGGPIVPPPPAPAGPPPGAPGGSPSPQRGRAARGGTPDVDYTPPVGNGPPGVVTVAGTNNGAVG